MVDIREAGVMGKGVFANQPISSETIIGEYLGRLHPLNSLKGGDMYIFLLNGTAEATSRQYGNFTRFVNHHCNPNVTARIGMYGKRQVILYVTNQDIKAGDQVFVSYGRNYFSGSGILCKCDDQQGDHLPGDPRTVTTSRFDAEQDVMASAKEAQAARNQDVEIKTAAGTGEKTQTNVSVQKNVKHDSSTKISGTTKVKRWRRKWSTAPSTLTKSAAVSKRSAPKGPLSSKGR
ncbi:hypothetical protein Daus18300_005650 [Diaporthe australafricana]|uniref:SET domain-containing protein n=1 Tax=Diaporthe australafricana TaxID=127596 RepID=A0ABR3WZY5_9PEZI